MITINVFNDFKSGKLEAFKLVFDSYYKTLFLFSKKYISDESEIEDLLQEVFTMLWEKKATLNNVMSVKAFLYVSVRNRALNIIRHQKVVEEHQQDMFRELAGESFYRNNLIEEETYRILISAINELPSQTQKVCRMVMNGTRNVDIAEELKISTSTVKYHKQQAFSILKKKLVNHIFVLPLLMALFE